MPHDAEGRNGVSPAGFASRLAPNGTIRLTIETVTDPETGKTAKKFCWRATLNTIQVVCMFCHSVNACPTGAIRFDRFRNHVVYTREKLVKQLNRQ